MEKLWLQEEHQSLRLIMANIDATPLHSMCRHNEDNVPIDATLQNQLNGVY